MTFRKLLPSLLIITVIGGFALTNPTQAHAQTSNNPFSGLVQAIAQKFGLDKAQVQSAVNDYKNQQKTNRQQNMQQKENVRLDKLVQQGKITSSQKQQVLDEIAKLQSEYNFQNFKSMTGQQRKDAISKEKAEIQAWSQSTGINAKYLMPFGMGMKRGWFIHKPSPTPTS